MNLIYAQLFFNKKSYSRDSFLISLNNKSFSNVLLTIQGMRRGFMGLNFYTDMYLKLRAWFYKLVSELLLNIG